MQPLTTIKKLRYCVFSSIKIIGNCHLIMRLPKSLFHSTKNKQIYLKHVRFPKPACKNISQMFS